MKGKALGMLMALAVMSGAPVSAVIPSTGGGRPPKKPDDRKDTDTLAPGWVPYAELDFTDTTVARYSIDTRDFHGITSTHYEEKGMPWERKCERNPDWYIHSADEVRVLLDRYYEESGGKLEWRYFNLRGIYRAQHWKLKYIRIYRCYQGLLVCNDEGFIMSKVDLKAPVDKEFLNPIHKEHEP